MARYASTAEYQHDRHTQLTRLLETACNEKIMLLSTYNVDPL